MTIKLIYLNEGYGKSCYIICFSLIIFFNILTCKISINYRRIILQPSSKDLTLLLAEISKGNKDVINEIFPVVYNELRKLASRYLYHEHGQRTIQTTELVHEAYLKIIGGESVSPENKSHFFGIAANAMRQLLVDFARKRNAEKRGGDHARVTLGDENLFISGDYENKILDIDNALKKLSEFDERLGKVVELRFFAGLNVEETSSALGCSPSTIKREWSLAKAWLFRELGEG